VQKCVYSKVDKKLEPNVCNHFITIKNNDSLYNRNNGNKIYIENDLIFRCCIK